VLRDRISSSKKIFIFDKYLKKNVIQMSINETTRNCDELSSNYDKFETRLEEYHINKQLNKSSIMAIEEVCLILFKRSNL
jgi:FKBP-type peptidyl-prolyl cis-trans isomerase (trigger factor)